MKALGGFVLGLSVVAALLFAGVGLHELSYASDHPHAYGPAKVIATGAGAGVLVAVALALVGWAMTRLDEAQT